MIRKIIIFLGKVPSSIRKYSERALSITTKVLQFLQSDVAITITNLIPGDTDEAVRVALIAVLNEFKYQLDKCKKDSYYDRKEVAAKMATSIISKLDGNKLDNETYRSLFEKVFKDLKGK